MPPHLPPLPWMKSSALLIIGSVGKEVTINEFTIKQEKTGIDFKFFIEIFTGFISIAGCDICCSVSYGLD